MAQLSNNEKARLSDYTKLTVSLTIGLLATVVLSIPIFDNSSGFTAAALFLVVCLVGLGIPLFLYFRKLRSEAFEGVIQAKDSEERTSSDADGNESSATLYFIIVKLTDNSQKRVYISKKSWSEWQVGQVVRKRPGKFKPEIA